MTTPEERTRAVIQMSVAVRDLACQVPPGSTETVRVSRQAIADLFSLLRHYPTQSELAQSAQRDPYYWGAPP